MAFAAASGMLLFLNCRAMSGGLILLHISGTKWLSSMMNGTGRLRPCRLLRFYIIDDANYYDTYRHAFRLPRANFICLIRTQLLRVDGCRNTRAQPLASKPLSLPCWRLPFRSIY